MTPGENRKTEGQKVGNDIRNRPFPVRFRPDPVTEEHYKFPDGSTCHLWLTNYGWNADHGEKRIACRTLKAARRQKDYWLLEVCTEMSEKARGIQK